MNRKHTTKVGEKNIHEIAEELPAKQSSGSSDAVCTAGKISNGLLKSEAEPCLSSTRHTDESTDKVRLIIQDSMTYSSDCTHCNIGTHDLRSDSSRIDDELNGPIIDTPDSRSDSLRVDAELGSPIIDISDCRAIIDKIDIELLNLLEKRLRIAESVARYKHINGLEIIDSAREANLLKRLGEMSSPDLRDLNLEIFRSIISASCKHQQNLLNR